MITSIKILTAAVLCSMFVSNEVIAQQWILNGTNIYNTNSGNVGIGTTNPYAKLQVTNGSMLFEGIVGNTPINGLGTRMMWIPSKSAFRAGTITSSMLGTNAWDDQFIGAGSSAFGYNTSARGNYSFAVGAINIASGIASFGAGQGNFVPGDNASAFGKGTTAQAYCSFVIGRANINPGNYSSTSWIPTDPIFVIGNGLNYQSPSNAVTVLKNGNVLINKINQVNSNYKLDVNGSIRANEVVVNTTGADFVFKNDYYLMKLKNLEQYIKQNKHLPDIPAACEMQTNGMSVSELNTTLLRKIEELTLYIIEQNKRIDALEKTVAKQQSGD